VSPTKPPVSRSISGTPTAGPSRWMRFVNADTETPSLSALDGSQVEIHGSDRSIRPTEAP
jgi:hypothetical protein